MKTSRGAYRLMKQIVSLVDKAGQVNLNKKVRSQVFGEISGRNFRYLCDKSYIRRLEGDRFEVTDLARINLLKELIRKRRPDGKLRVVIFDIPEKLRTSRNVFRQHLIDLGFRMRQQSVWVSSLPCEDLIALVVKYHGLGRFVELIVGSSVPIRKTTV